MIDLPPKALTSDTTAEEIADRAKAKELADTIHQQDLMWLLGDSRGKRIVLSLLARTGVLGQGFHVDAGQMAYLQGRRSIGVELMGDFKSTVPKLYPALFLDNVNA